MSTNYPSGLDSYTTRNNGDTIQPSHINNLQDAVVAIETALGTNLGNVPSGDGGTYRPIDQGFRGWSFDPLLGSTGSNVTNAGTIYYSAIRVPACTVTKIGMFMVNSGGTLTNAFGAIYNSSGTLLQTSSNGASTINALGATPGYFELTVSSQALSAGLVYVGFWFTGGSGSLGVLRAGTSNTAVLNANLSSPFRFSSGTTGLTTTAPGTMGTTTASTVAQWMALR